MRLPSRNFCAPDIREQQELSRILREKRTDIVLCHFGPVALSMLPVARSLNIPIVAHFHGYDLSSMLSHRWYRWALAANLGRFAALLVVGSHQKQWLLTHGAPAGRVHLIPCGAPVEEFQKLEKKTANGRLRFIAVGRLVPCKGVKYTVEAFATLRQEGIDAELIIIGEGPERERLFRMAEALNVHGRVTFRGALPNGLVRDELSQADIFVQHSVESEDGAREGFGVSIAEASASALPVIATRCGGILDQIVDGATGLLVAQRDVRGMADAMIRLARDPDLQMSLGLAGRARTVEEFNAARQIEKLENVLVAAVAARP